MVYLFPRLREIWVQSGFAEPVITTMFEVTLGVFQHALWIGILLVAGMALVEWRCQWWPRYRKGLVEFGALAFNAAILVVITTMLTSALLAVPALHRTP